jgi:hypothetical protein
MKGVKERGCPEDEGKNTIYGEIAQPGSHSLKERLINVVAQPHASPYHP